jgi:hypothetical protein
MAWLLAGPSAGLVLFAADRNRAAAAAAKHGKTEARYRRESLGRLRARLGDEQADRAYAEGMALSLAQALNLAIGTARTT